MAYISWTLFAYCDESGLAKALKDAVLGGIPQDDVRVRTDPRASPTGYPFKVVMVESVAHQERRLPDAFIAPRKGQNKRGRDSEG